MSLVGDTAPKAPVRSACDLLLAALVLPPVLLHLLKYSLVFLFPFFDPLTMRTVLSWAMPTAYLFLATPLSLLALPGAIRLVKALPEPPHFALFMRVLAAIFALMTVAATAARFTSDMEIAAGLQDAAGLAKLAVGLGVSIALVTGKARAPRALLILSAVIFAAALLLQSQRIWLGWLSPRFMVLVRGSAAALLAAALLLARRGDTQAAR